MQSVMFANVPMTINDSLKIRNYTKKTKKIKHKNIIKKYAYFISSGWRYKLFVDIF